MAKEKGVEVNKAKHPEEKVFWIVGLAILALFGAPGVFIYFFHDLDGGGPSGWAKFGTYFSGIATPIIAFCSALLFYRSIIVQRDEFEKTRQKMEDATQLQVQTERNQYNQNKQKQLECTIPKVRELQLHFYNQVKSFPDVYRDSIGAYSNIGFETSRHKLRQIAEKEGVRDKLRRLLRDYFDKGRHTIKMINQYLDCGGDIYFHSDVIDTLEQEHGNITIFIGEFSLQDDGDYTDYYHLLETFLMRRDEAMISY